jgi:hypothetical protein
VGSLYSSLLVRPSTLPRLLLKNAAVCRITTKTASLRGQAYFQSIYMVVESTHIILPRRWIKINVLYWNLSNLSNWVSPARSVSQNWLRRRAPNE